MAFALAVALLGAHAHAQTAPTKRQCADAYTQAQVLRSQDKLVLAKEQVDLCNDPACPQALRTDCAAWLVELEESTPVLSVDVVTERGDARLTVDGNTVTSGAAVPLDPGPHTMIAEATGLQSATQTVVLSKGEKRRVTLTLAALPTLRIPETPRPKLRAYRPFPAAPVVVGAVGLALVGGFATFGLLGNAKRSDLDASACAPNCSPGDVDAIRTDYTVAGVMLGLGITTLAVAAIWLILVETAPAQKRAISWRSLELIF